MLSQKCVIAYIANIGCGLVGNFRERGKSKKSGSSSIDIDQEKINVYGRGNFALKFLREQDNSGSLVYSGDQEHREKSFIDEKLDDQTNIKKENVYLI